MSGHREIADKTATSARGESDMASATKLCHTEIVVSRWIVYGFSEQEAPHLTTSSESSRVQARMVVTSTRKLRRMILSRMISLPSPCKGGEQKEIREESQINASKSL